MFDLAIIKTDTASDAAPSSGGAGDPVQDRRFFLKAISADGLLLRAVAIYLEVLNAKGQLVTDGTAVLTLWTRQAGAAWAAQDSAPASSGYMAVLAYSITADQTEAFVQVTSVGGTLPTSVRLRIEPNEKLGVAVPPQQVAPQIANAGGLGGTATIRVPLTAAGPGSADDVLVFNANAPFKFRIVDSKLHVSTLIAASTVTLRDTVGGAGTALSDAWSSATTGVKRDTALTATPVVALGGTLTIRRSDNGVAGEVVLMIERVP